MYSKTMTFTTLIGLKTTPSGLQDHIYIYIPRRCCGESVQTPKLELLQSRSWSSQGPARS